MERLLRFRDLEYFIAVAEHRSFAKAANALAVAQPTLSNQIRRIEESLQAKLFRREGREATLTPEGALFLDHARRVMAAFYDMEQAARGARAFAGGAIRFGMIPTLSPYLGPPLLSAIRARNAGGPVAFREALTDELESLVAKGELDFAVLATLPRSAELTARRIAVEPLSYLSAQTPPEDPFAPEADGDAMRPVLLMHGGHCFRETVYAAISRVNAASAESIDYSVAPASLSTLTSLVRRGVGDAVVPTPFVSAEPDQSAGLTERRLDPAIFQRTLHLVVRAGREHQAGLEQAFKLAVDCHAALTVPDRG